MTGALPGATSFNSSLTVHTLCAPPKHSPPQHHPNSNRPAQHHPNSNRPAQPIVQPTTAAQTAMHDRTIAISSHISTPGCSLLLPEKHLHSRSVSSKLSRGPGQMVDGRNLPTVQQQHCCWSMVLQTAARRDKSAAAAAAAGLGWQGGISTSCYGSRAVQCVSRGDSCGGGCCKTHVGNRSHSIFLVAGVISPPSDGAVPAGAAAAAAADEWLCISTSRSRDF